MWVGLIQSVGGLSAKQFSYRRGITPPVCARGIALQTSGLPGCIIT
jgi:hypothetical protein